MCVAPPKISRVGATWVVYTTVYMNEHGIMDSLLRPLATFHGVYAEVNARRYAEHMVMEMCGGSCLYGPSPAKVDYGPSSCNYTGEVNE